MSSMRTGTMFLPIISNTWHSEQTINIYWMTEWINGKAMFPALLKSYHDWPKNSKVPSAKWNIFMQSKMIPWMSQYPRFSSMFSCFKFLTPTEEVGNGHDEEKEESWVWLGSWRVRREWDGGGKLSPSPGMSQQVHGCAPEWKKVRQPYKQTWVRL